MATYWENSCSFGLRYVSWYKYLIVSLVFSHLGFWSGNLFLIAPFPDLCLLVPFQDALEQVTHVRTAYILLFCFIYHPPHYFMFFFFFFTEKEIVFTDYNLIYIIYTWK